jgi:hypothetical protein
MKHVLAFPIIITVALILKALLTNSRLCSVPALDQFWGLEVAFSGDNYSLTV